MNQKALILENQIQTFYPKMTKAEKRVADYVLSNIDDITNLSAQEIGSLSQTGAATVVRFCRKCGFVGLSDLKASLQRSAMVTPRQENLHIEKEDSVSVIKHKVLSFHESLIERLNMEIDEEALMMAADAILNAKKAIVSGSGDSSAMAVILNNNLDMHGWESFFTTDPIQEAAHITHLSPEDVMIGFTYSGRFMPTVKNLEIAKNCGITTIGILGMKGCPAEEFLDIKIYSNISDDERVFGSQASLAGDFIVIEILTAILASRRPVSSEHTAKMNEIIEYHRVQKEDNNGI